VFIYVAKVYPLQGVGNGKITGGMVFFSEAIFFTAKYVGISQILKDFSGNQAGFRVEIILKAFFGTPEKTGLCFF
jgi:hypothetical protein